MLGLAFHPDYKKNGYFYVNYTRGGKDLETAISRFQVSKTNASVADPVSEEVLLTYTQPFNNHNGGKAAFGNDGYLYIAVGDGGSGGDPHNNGQISAELRHCLRHQQQYIGNRQFPKLLSHRYDY